MRKAAIWIVILSLAAGSLPAQETRGGDESMLGRPDGR